MYAHLAAEQIDAVALGLKQMEKGNGFIIGDQAGVSKGETLPPSFAMRISKEKREFTINSPQSTQVV